MWRSNTAGRKANTTDCRHLQPIWFTVKWPRSSRPAAPSALAAKAATATIPIVFAVGGRPGRGRACHQPEPTRRQPDGRDQLERRVGPKRLELLHELVPTATIVAVLVNPTNPCRDLCRETAGGGPHARAAAPCSACEQRTRLRCGLCSLGPTASRRARDQSGRSCSTAHSEQLAALTLRHAVPAIFQYREFAAAGGLDELRRQR